MTDHLVLCADYDLSPLIAATEVSSCRTNVWETGRRLGPADADLFDLRFESEEPHSVPLPDFTIDATGCPIFSSRLRALLEAEGVHNVDYYPAALTGYEGSGPQAGYWAGNILGLVTFLDRARSRFREVGGRITDVEQLAIDGPREGIPRLFRLQEVPSVILIDRAFRRIFDQAGITGARLVPAGLWEGAYGFEYELARAAA